MIASGATLHEAPPDAAAGPEAAHRPDARIPSPLATVLLAAWLGAAALLAAAVAPAVFAVLPDRALAGAVVGRVLPVVFVSGVLGGLLTVLLDRSPGPDARARWRGAGAIVTAMSCAIAQFVVGPRIAALRAAIGPSLQSLPLDDPQRRVFGQLHAFSVAWLAVAMLAAAVAVMLGTVALGRARRSAS